MQDRKTKERVMTIPVVFAEIAIGVLIVLLTDE